MTDLFDGSVARGLNEITEFGAMLDSTADRILIIPIAFYALFKFQKWLLLALVLAEIINAVASMFYKSKEIYQVVQLATNQAVKIMFDDLDLLNRIPESNGNPFINIQKRYQSSAFQIFLDLSETKRLFFNK